MWVLTYGPRVSFTLIGHVSVGMRSGLLLSDHVLISGCVCTPPTLLYKNGCWGNYDETQGTRNTCCSAGTQKNEWRCCALITLGTKVRCVLNFEEFTALHHFLGLRGMFRNSYLTGAMLPYKATMAPGGPTRCRLVFCHWDESGEVVAASELARAKANGMQEMLDAPLGSL